MIWLRAFFVGLFTNHLGTKLLALLLSLGLFSFVQFSQQENREIPELELIVTLDSQLHGQYVLLTPRLRIENVAISGPRSRVNSLVRQHLQAPLPVEINERFLRLHRDRLDIPVTPEFFKDDALWGADIKVDELQSDLKIELDELENRPRVPVAVDPDANRVLPKDHRYQGTLEDDALRVYASIQQVTLVGPKRVFGENPRIVVKLPDLAQALNHFDMTKEQDEAPVSDLQIDWEAGDIDPQYVEHLLFSARELGALPSTARAFQSKLEVHCTVLVRKVSKEVSIPIEVRAGKGAENIDDWDSGGKPILSKDIKERLAGNFPLRMPKSLADDKDFLAKLVLILNVADAEKEDDGTLRVPVYLDLKGDRRPQDLERLRRIDIESEQRWVEFRPK
ncbi:MAG: hypothetical protein ACYTG3_04045 [Planctomycetota bacterium]|jgi:hypothetical protein